MYRFIAAAAFVCVDMVPISWEGLHDAILILALRSFRGDFSRKRKVSKIITSPYIFMTLIL